MTKAKLIQLLEPYPDDIRLVTGDSEYNGLGDLNEPEEVHVMLNTNKKGPAWLEHERANDDDEGAVLVLEFS